LLTASFIAQSQNILVKYELLSHGKVIENQELNLLYQDHIFSGKHTIKVLIPMGSPEGGSSSAWNVSRILVGNIKKD
jgi:hypothetical protein